MQAEMLFCARPPVATYTYCDDASSCCYHLSACQDAESLQVNGLSFFEASLNEASQLISIFSGAARLKVGGCHRTELHIEPQRPFIWPDKANVTVWLPAVSQQA